MVSAAEGGWQVLSQPPALRERAAHVWRIQIDRPAHVDALFPLLSTEERRRARAFHFERDRTRFVLAHGMTRRILAGYLATEAAALEFDAGHYGKPSLRGAALEFNLSHSGDLALLAVSASCRVGVDVERWDERTEHLHLAGQFFSAAECASLRALAGTPASVIEGFFSAWSRKEAYLKATGHGVSRGLDHFDVSLTPGAPARLLADRLDPNALARWIMNAIPAGEGYSAALVVEAPAGEILLFDAP